METRATEIDRDRMILKVQSQSTGAQQELPYDALILAPGAGAIMPWPEARAAENVFACKTIPDADAIKAFMKSNSVKNVTIVGAGFIGVELCEAMLNLGLEVNLLEAAPQIVPAFDADIALELQSVLETSNINVIVGDAVQSFQISGNKASGVLLASGKVNFQQFVSCKLSKRLQCNYNDS